MWYASIIAPLFDLHPSVLEPITNWTLNSKDVKPGSLYVAIKGEKVDGHRFLADAENSGAVVALVEKSYTKTHKNLVLIKVENVPLTLQKMAKKIIESWKPVVIAITGSIGKTSTKDFAYTLLKNTLDIYKTPLSYNSQLTVPLTILNTKKPHSHLLLEMGMNQPGELNKLIDIAPPDIAVLTQIAHVHLEAFATFQKLAEEKCKIFSHPKTTLGFYTPDMPFADLAACSGKIAKKSCSLKCPQADYFLEEKNKLFFFYKKGQLKGFFKPPLFDVKSRINLLFALALADFFEVPIPVLQKQIQQIEFPANRMNLISHKGITYLNDAYNSCVESVENALMSLPHHGGRKIAILSDMVEQGAYSETNHKKITELALQHADILVGFGSEMHVMIPLCRNSGKKWALFLSYPHLLSYVSKLVQKNDAVLIKGSRKRALDRLVHDITLS